MTPKNLEPFSVQSEQAITAFWKKNKVSQKARTQNAKSKKTFYFMDGPPYATGYIHMGTALNKVLKDFSMRSKRMQGFDVFDRPGYDTHGLPIENKVEQKKGFKTKQDIEEFGIENFVKECRKFATEFIDVQNKQFESLGVWMDWNNPYVTLSNEYIDAMWWTFRKAYDKGLLYLGKYPIHACPHCETAVAYNEIEYVKQTDTSVYVKFPFVEDPKKFFLIWTTTPWTLPANTGIMVHPKYEYVEAEVGGEIWIIAKDRLEPVMNAIEAGYRVLKTFPGKELEGKKYLNPLAVHMNLPKFENAYRVILSERYVNVDDGTGLVHTAPGHGKEDYDAGSKAGLPIYCPVGLNGMLNEETGKYAGKKARVVDLEIMDDLRELGALLYQHPYTHDYPVCWRCKTPLLMVSVAQWFFRISTIQKRMLELNEQTNWVPYWMQDRMANWIEGIGDWPISRARFWGTPLPIWICDKCQKQHVFGGIADVEKASGKKISDPHKPWIDAITIKCDCGGVAKRIPEVLDVWFDAGASSWAALDFPKRKDLFERYWPADLNIEGTDQVRGWWNSELILSVICFDRLPYKAIATHGMVLDLGKKKMSKSAGNFVEPLKIAEQYSVDFLRYYLAKKSTGTDLSFEEKELQDVQKFVTILHNSFQFANLYLDIDYSSVEKKSSAKMPVEDEWLLSKTNSLLLNGLKHYNSYEYFKIVPLIEQFVMEDLSRTYIKLVRDRVETPSQKSLEHAFGFALLSVIKLLAPLMPHLSEHYFQTVKTPKMAESVHLLSFLDSKEADSDLELEKEFDSARELLQSSLALREEQKLRLRWPLKRMVIVTETGKKFSKTLDMIKTAANVKEVREEIKAPEGEFAKKQTPSYSLLLDISADDALRDEWEATELRRRIQDLRKQSDLSPGQITEIELDCDDPAFVLKFKKQIESETATKIISGKGEMQKLLLRSFFLKIRK